MRAFCGTLHGGLSAMALQQTEKYANLASRRLTVLGTLLFRGLLIGVSSASVDRADSLGIFSQLPTASQADSASLPAQSEDCTHYIGRHASTADILAGSSSNAYSDRAHGQGSFVFRPAIQGTKHSTLPETSGEVGRLSSDPLDAV